MVQSINYVQGSSPHKKTFTPRKQEELPIKRQGKCSLKVLRPSVVVFVKIVILGLVYQH